MRTRIAVLLAGAGVLVASLGAGARTGAAQEYKIGFLHSFSGYTANMGTVSRDGFLLAVDEINKKGGVDGRPIKVFVENDESDPSKGVPAAIRLIDAEKVLAVVGPARSDITEALGPIAEKAQVVNMTCSFILPTKGEYTFSTVPSPQEEARVALDFLKAKGAKSLGLLGAIDLYDKLSAKAFADEAEKRGIKVLASENYNAAVDKNFIPQLTKIKAANPEWLVVLGSGAPVPVILNQKAEIGFGGPVLGNFAFAAGGIPPLIKNAGKNAQGVYFTTLPVAVWETLPKDDPRLKLIVQFREGFKAKYGEYPVMANWWTAQSYDIGFLLAEALKKAGANATGATLKTAIEGIKDFHGVVGSFSFAPTQHAGATGTVVGQIEGERVILAK